MGQKIKPEPFLCSSLKCVMCLAEADFDDFETLAVRGQFVTNLFAEQ
jgi:hypothetical protein